MRYYIAENGQPVGPFEANELLARGLTANSLVWGEGMSGWTSASLVPELAALLSGGSVGTSGGGLDVQVPQMPPMGGNVSVPPLPEIPQVGGDVSLPQVPPITNPAPTGQGGTTLPNNPLPFPQGGPTTTNTQQAAPKTWLVESIVVTAASLMCCFNIVGLITGALAIFKAYGVKTKFMKGDIAGANKNSASAKKFVLITLAIGIIWSIIQGFRIVNDSSFLPEIQKGNFGIFYTW